jgi:hypothetical protein
VELSSQKPPEVGDYLAKSICDSKSSKDGESIRSFAEQKATISPQKAYIAAHAP